MARDFYSTADRMMALERHRQKTYGGGFGLQGVGYGAGFGPWYGPIEESFAGAWQRNIVVAPTQTLLAVSAIYACITGIASDIAKIRIRLTQETADGIWTEVTDNTTPYFRVLKKPNRYQNRIKFIEQWVVSKLEHGNTYVLKERESARGMVKALYILHPHNVKPLVAEDGAVYYEITRDDLSGVKDTLIVPASEIIHDMTVGLWHPLVGVSPLYACAMAGTMSSKILDNSTYHFQNRSMPGGVVTVPGEILQSQADAVKAAFESNYSGVNLGRVAVLGDGMTFSPLAMTAMNSQLVEQLEWTVQDVARAFHYPMRKLQVPMPYASNPEPLQVEYYSGCLQQYITSIEQCLDEGLEVPDHLWPQFDLDDLLRMDTVARTESSSKAVLAAIMTPNEARRIENRPPVAGGNAAYLQQQNFSLEALAKRDASDDPFGTKPPPAPTAPTPPPPPAAPPNENNTEKELDPDVAFELVECFDAVFTKGLSL